MSSVDAVLDWLKGKVPPVLAPAFGGGIACLTAAALIIKTMRPFEWRTVLECAAFLYTVTGVLLYWAIVLVRHRKVPSLRWAVSVGLPVLVIASGLTLYAAVRQSRYTYNEMGMYQSRSWKQASIQGQNETFTFEVIAVEDLSKRPFIVTASSDTRCPQATLVDFSPSLSEDGAYRPLLTEITDPERSKETRAWRIEGFQPPSKLVFAITVRNISQWVGYCFIYDLRWETGKR